MSTTKERIQKRIQTNSRQRDTLRSNLAYNLGGGYHHGDTKRDVWSVAGYPDVITFDMLWNMQARNGIAKAGIHLIVNKCWESLPIITDGEYDGERALTAFEKDLDVLITKHKLFSRLKGADWRGRIGRYSALLPIVKESSSRTPKQAPEKSRGIDALVKIVPLMESEVTTDNVETISDINDINYGMPTHYMLRQNAEGNRNPIDNSQIELNPERVFIFAEGADDGSIFGVPANEAGFNDLLDITKTLVSGSEGLYKNSKQRLVHNINDNQIADILSNNEDAQKDWDEQNKNFSTGFDSSLVTYGIDTKTLQSMISDPTPAFTNSLNSFAASHGIPATEFIGAQMNTQATASNSGALINAAESRRDNTLTPYIMEFLEYLIARGLVKPPTNEILIEWPELSQPTVGEKLDNSAKMAEVNKKNFDSGRAENVFTEEEIRQGKVFEEKPEEDLEMFEEEDEPEDINIDDEQDV